MKLMIPRLLKVPVVAMVTAAAAFVVDASAQTMNRPNVLLIVSDSQGYADAGFQGSKDIQTPNLDQLAKDGIRCTNAYVTNAGSPSRAGLLTGRYPARFGYERNPRWLPEDHSQGLPTSETLFPALMAKTGYVTGWIGAWFLGAAPEFHPEKRGFTETYGFLGGGHEYQNWTAGDAEGTQPILRNGKPEDTTQHLTVAFGHEAASFVTRHKTQPWFLYLAFNAPNWPQRPTSERYAKFSHVADHNRRGYAAQLSLMDDAIGETLEALKKTGQDRRTLVFFLTTNGGPQLCADNSPFRDGPMSEAGFHVPFVVSWPGRLPSGNSYSGLVSSMDVAATALTAAGVPAPTTQPLDGVSLFPFLTGKAKGAPHSQLFWRYNPTLFAVRSGDLKLIRPGGNDSRPELYDLSKDPRESEDLASSRAADVQILRNAARQWSAGMSKTMQFPWTNTTTSGPVPFGTLDPEPKTGQ